MREIPLTQGKVAIVDDEDYSEISKYRWYARTDGRGRSYYAVRNIIRISPHSRQTSIRMHRVIMNIPNGMECDHINGNTLDNRKENLRIVTHHQNAQNLHVPKTSKHVGVCWDKENKNWRAQIKFKGKRHHLGSFSNEQEAATAYRVASVVLAGVDVL